MQILQQILITVFIFGIFSFYTPPAHTAGASSLLAQQKNPNNDFKTYQSHLGYSFKYRTGWAEDISCVADDSGEDSGCPIIIFSTKESPSEQFHITYLPIEYEKPEDYFKKRRKNAGEEFFHIEQINKKGLIHTVYLSVNKESDPNIEISSGTVLWGAMSRCNGKQLHISVDYSRRLYKDDRIKLRREGRPPKNLLLLLDNLICDSPDSVPKEKTFKSPLGLVEIKISSEVFENISKPGTYIKYELEFSKNGSKFSSTWNGGHEGLPQIDSIFKNIGWSPNEKMATLGGDVISLDPSTSWRKAETKIWDKIWIDDWHAVANMHSDCDYGVFMFDGTEGEDVVIGHEPSPIAYGLIGIPNAKRILVKKFEDNCARPDSEFVPVSCFEFDLKKHELKPIKCPSGI